MKPYQRLLLVVDLSSDSRVVTARAVQLAAASAAAIELLHVVEYLPVEPMNDTLMPSVEIEGELVQNARRKLTALAAEFGLQQAPQFVETGLIKQEILRLARERNTDLIVLGSRERHGLSILVNFTEDTVLHGAPCDVLAVRLTDSAR